MVKASQQWMGLRRLRNKNRRIVGCQHSLLGHLQATLSKLLTNRVLRLTQLPALSGTGNSLKGYACTDWWPPVRWYVYCLHRGSNSSLGRTVDGRIMRCGIPLGHANQPQLTTSRDCKALLVTSHYNVISEVYANDSKQGGGWRMAMHFGASVAFC